MLSKPIHVLLIAHRASLYAIIVVASFWRGNHVVRREALFEGHRDQCIFEIFRLYVEQTWILSALMNMGIELQEERVVLVGLLYGTLQAHHLSLHQMTNVATCRILRFAGRRIAAREDAQE